MEQTMRHTEPEKRRFEVQTGPGVYHRISAVDEDDARDQFDIEVMAVTALEPKYSMYKSELEWNEDHYMTFGSWIDDAIQTNDIREWVSSWSDWQLRFYLEPDADVSYEPGQQKALIFDSAKEDYMFTQLGDEHPPGVGELTYLSVDLVEHQTYMGDPVKLLKVSCSFENTLDERMVQQILDAGEDERFEYKNLEIHTAWDDENLLFVNEQGKKVTKKPENDIADWLDIVNTSDMDVEDLKECLDCLDRSVN